MKRLITAILMVLFFAGAVFAVDVSAPVFIKANDAYRQGQYDQAVELYETILTSGYKSGPLHYNLGNSYFKKQQLGKAILHYERARRLMPRDIDLAANFQFALSAVKGHHENQRNLWKDMWHRFVQFYSLNEMVMILVLLLVLSGFSHLTFLYFSWKPGRPVMVILGVLFIIFAYGLQFKLETERDAAVMVRTSAARFEPHEKATVYFELFEGQRCQSQEKEGEWVKIKRSDGKTGWVEEKSIEKI